MEYRIVLIGKTGSGKSATGNTILGETKFQVKSSPESVTKTCSMFQNQNQLITVVDTPGIFDTSLDKYKLKKEIEKCIHISVPGPHAFLLVIRLGRFTQEEQNAVMWIQENYGEDAALYTIILFTHADQLGNRTVEEFCRDSKVLQRLKNSCGDRYHSFNNNDSNPSQVLELLEKIKQMVHNNGGKHYTSAMYEEAQKKINASKWNKYYLAATTAFGAIITIASFVRKFK